MNTVRLMIHQPTNSGRRRGWTKHVTAVDTSKTNGYAFEGDFLPSGEVDLPIGAILVRQYPEGSVKNGYHSGKAFRVTEEPGLEDDHLEEVASTPHCARNSSVSAMLLPH